MSPKAKQTSPINDVPIYGWRPVIRHRGGKSFRYSEAKLHVLPCEAQLRSDEPLLNIQSRSMEDCFTLNGVNPAEKTNADRDLY